MYRTTGEPTGVQSSNGDTEMADLQSTLERIDLQGRKQESQAVDEVADILRKKLKINFEDDADFNSLASHLLKLKLASSPKTQDSEQSAGANNSPAKSPQMKEPELQKTWSGETSSTDNSQPDVQNAPSAQPISGSFSSSPPAESQEIPAPSETVGGGRGRSPFRNAKNAGATVSAPENTRGSNRPPTSDTKAKRDSRTTRRSQSPFRFFNRKAKDTQTEGAQASPTVGAPLQSRSFDKGTSATISGNTTPNRPPMSPFPPSSATSFGSSNPPTPYTPGISIVGLATPGDMPSYDEFGTPLSSTPMSDKVTGQNMNDEAQQPGTMPAADGAAAQTMNPKVFTPSLRGRQRPRTPSRDHPGLNTPLQGHRRSQSVPRTNHSDKSRTSPFRNLSPGRFFGRFAPNAKATKEQPSQPVNRENQQQPMEEDVFSRAAQTAPRVTVAATPVATEPSPQVQGASLPKSSPLKTPASRMTNDTEFKTGKNKLRRKMEEPLENVASPGSLASADDSLSSLEGDVTVPNVFPSVFNVDLSKAPKSHQGTRRVGATRRNTAPAIPSQAPAAKPTQAVRTPAPSVQTNTATWSPEPMLTPMDTESKLNTSVDSFGSGSSIPGVAAGQSNIQFSIGGAGAPAGRRQAKRGPRARTGRASFRQQSVNGGVAPPFMTQPAASVPANTGAPRHTSVPVSTSTAEQAQVEHVRILGCVSALREEGRKYYEAKNYEMSISSYTQAINYHAKLDPCSTPGDLLALLLSNRAAGMLMVRAPDACMRDCNMALANVSPLMGPQFYLAPDSGIILKHKLYTRIARAHIKKGDPEGAQAALNKAAENVEGAMAICNQHFQSNPADFSSKRITLTQKFGEITLLQSQEVRQLQHLMSTIAKAKIPSLRQVGGAVDISNRKHFVELLSQVGSALSLAPCCVDLHEKKIALLASLKKWREVLSHCERIGAGHVLLDRIPTLAADYTSMKLFVGISAAKHLRPDFFGTEDFKITNFESAMQKLGTAGAVEAVMRLPHSLAAIYLRALRLEERYPQAESCLTALEEHVRSKNGSREFEGLALAFSWTTRERSQVVETRRSRNRGDGLFLSNSFDSAIEEYGKCMKIDSGGVAVEGSATAGGRLHAILHCNRAACLMSLGRFEEAKKECDSALRIHTRYMKALSRRARCNAKMKNYDLAAIDFTKYVSFRSIIPLCLL